MVRGTGGWGGVSEEEAGGEDDEEGGRGHHGFPVCVHPPSLPQASLKQSFKS